MTAVLDVDALVEMRDNMGAPADVDPHRLSESATSDRKESTPWHTGS